MIVEGKKKRCLSINFFFKILIVTSVTYIFVAYTTKSDKTRPFHGSITSAWNITTTKIKQHPTNCVTDAKCINKKYALLRHLGREIIKPSAKPRTIYLKTMGRFGNILYQFAALLALAKATCATVKISSKHKVQDIFEQVPFEVLTEAKFDRHTKNIPFFNLFKDHLPEEMAVKTALQRDVRLQGVFASPRWFSGCFDEIKDKIRVKDEHIRKGLEIIENLIRKSQKYNVTTVGVHVRRGDKALNKNHKLPSIAYFGKAMSYFKNKYRTIMFIVTSDDRMYAIEKFVQLSAHYSDIVMAPKSNFEVDFAILYQCNFVIQSEGTFSQWAALMNGHESIYSKEYKGNIWPNWVPI